MIFIFFVSFVIILRIGELLVSKRNERWLLQNGAIEYGQKHYPFIVTLHVLFLCSLIVEYLTQQTHYCSFVLLLFYFLLLILKTWVIMSLGKYWNTKIFHIPGSTSVKKGPYQFIKHPNYVIVVAEIAVIPIAFHLYFTAIVFSLLNFIMLYVRIKEENKIL